MNMINTLDRDPYFQDSIVLDKAMPVSQAIACISDFHHAKIENVIKTFSSLQTGIAKQILFRKGTNSWQECLVMEGQDADGKCIWSHLIDKHTGQPIMRCG